MKEKTGHWLHQKFNACCFRSNKKGRFGHMHEIRSARIFGKVKAACTFGG